MRVPFNVPDAKKKKRNDDKLMDTFLNIYIRFQGVDSSSSQFGHSIRPVLMWNPKVVHGPGNISEGFAILEELVAIVIDCKTCTAALNFF